MAPPVTFLSTGAEQSYTVPSGVALVSVAAWGAWGAGAAGGPGHYSTAFGQNPAAWQGLLAVTPGQSLYAEVGSNGSANGGADFGGGGAAGSPDPEGAEAGSGGGASDIRACSELASSCPGGATSSQSGLIVAGGSAGNGGSGVTAAAGLFCGSATGGGGANNEQPLPHGNAALGPLPIQTGAGLVIPGYAGGGDFTPRTVQGMTDAGGGSTAAGAGGSGTSCQGGGAYAGDTFFGNVPGSSGSGSDGGAGGDAAGLAPFACGTPGSCNDTGPGGGGGGGYLGGGGGSTGFNQCSASSSGCNAITASLGGGAGSSFIANAVIDPSPMCCGLGTGIPFVRFAPVVEIDSPANGAVYRPGQVVDATWSCAVSPGGFANGVQNCTAPAADGGAINTASPGSYTFTVSGVGPGNAPVSASVHYAVKAAGAGGGQRTAHGAVAGLKFALSLPSLCAAATGRLRVTLIATGSSRDYRLHSLSYFVGRGKARRKRVGKHRVVVYGPTLVVSHAGTASLPLSGLKAGAHPLKLVITLGPAAHHRAKAKTLILKLSFSVC